jgi:hypothetical protein
VTLTADHILALRRKNCHVADPLRRRDVTEESGGHLKTGQVELLTSTRIALEVIAIGMIYLLL